MKNFFKKLFQSNVYGFENETDFKFEKINESRCKVFYKGVEIPGDYWIVNNYLQDIFLNTLTKEDLITKKPYPETITLDFPDIPAQAIIRGFSGNSLLDYLIKNPVSSVIYQGKELHGTFHVRLSLGVLCLIDNDFQFITEENINNYVKI